MKLSVYLVTYNVGTVSPTENLQDLLSLHQDHIHDLYIIGLQEVRSQPQDFVLEELFGVCEAWTSEFQSVLKTRNYVLFEVVKLQGIVLLGFCLRKHLLNITNLEVNYTRTGLLGYWGNKGAVTIRFNYLGCSVCFVNTHMSAHENQIKSRINDFKMIVADQRFESDTSKDIFSHNYVFWLGDLNFRLNKDCTKSAKEVETLILDNRLNLLVQYDELKQVMLSKKAFHQFAEEFPRFAPTFKFKTGTSNYNCKRRPAWTDRILYKAVPKNGIRTFEVKHVEGSYISHGQYVASDHKPVTSEFLIKIPSGVKTDSVTYNYTRGTILYNSAVTFDNIEFLWNDEVNTIGIAVKTNIIDIKTAYNDWIAILPANFTNFNQYISYENVQNVILQSSEAKITKVISKFQCKIQNLPFTKLTSNKLCLVYFQRTKNGCSQNISGISNVFYVKTKQEIFYVNPFL